ncbi:LysR substrate-binding domain-containing protein [Phyllobacterium myrsinacearum]|uniref:LysR family glycine cleavage system transcriptional activator n=1 Tax=Phyllobacterium myrsinacearum TaxID=28101 RepID=A0A839ES42_9HYPH|nr:LysR substrate-binding domain-containing protein [Phyllobacterium myrsinacearum]MBA8879257.1 LysR family glycine cleavage system transcriptional activator [Phyllobacterium myrsinacearum]
MVNPIGKLPPLNGLRAFEVSARHLNFRLAAEELGVTQGAVAQHVRGLEAELGLALFERLPKSLALTGEGRAYIADIRRAFELIANATTKLRPQPVKLTVSTTPTFASKWLIPRLPDFRAKHPDLDLHILATDRISSFQSDGVDLAIRYGNPPFGTALAAELLFDQEIIPVCNPSLIAIGAEPHDGKALSQYTLLHDTHNFWPEYIDRFLGFSDPALFRSISFSQTSHAIEAAIAGQGIAMATLAFVSADIRAGRLRQVFDGVLLAQSGFYCVRPRYRKSDAVDKLQDWMTSQP